MIAGNRPDAESDRSGTARTVRGPAVTVRRPHGGRAGQALVELAFVSMVLAIILLGILEVVLIYNTRSYMSDAVREGVRAAALSYKDTTISSRMMEIIDAHGMNTAHNGVCDIQAIDIYRANNDGTVYAGPNNEDTYSFTYANGTCTPTLTYQGFPVSVRQAVSSPNAVPMNVGVQMYYRYYLRTPVLSAFGSYLTMQYDAVLALGEDNANDMLNLPSSTPVPTFTPEPPTATPTVTNTMTPTATSTITPTLTPSSTPCIPGTPTGSSGCPYTPTPIPPAPDATATPTFTPTPLPSPGQVSYTLLCIQNEEQQPPGITVQWDPVPGATGYQIWFHDNTTPPGSDALLATLSGNTSTQYPATTPPYYGVTLAVGSYWYVIPTYGTNQGPAGQTTAATTGCGLPTQ